MPAGVLDLRRGAVAGPDVATWRDPAAHWPALTVWRMNVSDVTVTPVDFSVAEDALIVHPDAEVEVRIVPPGGAAFVTALAAGGTLLSAAETAQAADKRFDLAGNIAGLLAAGAFCRIQRT